MFSWIMGGLLMAAGAVAGLVVAKFAAGPYYANGSHDAAFRVDSGGVGITAGAMESFRALAQTPLARQAWAFAQKRTPFSMRIDAEPEMRC
jgi:hypothetical protein